MRIKGEAWKDTSDEDEWEWVEAELEEMLKRYQKHFKPRKGLTKENLHYLIFNTVECV